MLEIGGIKVHHDDLRLTYVKGAYLATMLRREGTLLLATVPRIARAVVSGLLEPHKAGVVHRDLCGEGR